MDGLVVLRECEHGRRVTVDEAAEAEEYHCTFFVFVQWMWREVLVGRFECRVELETP